MLEVSDLTRIGLSCAYLTLKSGECVAVRGPSGAGKSLLLRAIADLDPNEGRVSLDGRSRELVSGPEWRHRVGYLPAEPGWWADTVGEHFPDWPAARALVERLGLPDSAGDWPLTRPSTGERLRLALIRALMGEFHRCCCSTSRRRRSTPSPWRQWRGWSPIGWRPDWRSCG